MHWSLPARYLVHTRYGDSGYLSMRSSFLGNRGFGSTFNEARGNVKSFDLLSDSDGGMSEALDADDGPQEVELDESLDESSPSAAPSPKPVQPPRTAAATSSAAPAAAPMTLKGLPAASSPVTRGIDVPTPAPARSVAPAPALDHLAAASATTSPSRPTTVMRLSALDGASPRTTTATALTSVSQVASAPLPSRAPPAAASAAPASIPTPLPLRAPAAATRKCEVETQTTQAMPPVDGSAQPPWPAMAQLPGWPGAPQPPPPWMYLSPWPHPMVAGMPPYGPQAMGSLPIAVPLSASHPLASALTTDRMPEAKVVGVLVGAQMR